MFTFMELTTCTAVVLVVLFAVLYYFRPVSLMTGFAFDLLLAALLGIGGILVIENGNSGNALAMVIFLLLAAVAMFVLLCGVYVIVGYLLWNSIQLLRRERHSLQNMLSLFVAVGLLAEIILMLCFGRQMQQYPVLVVLVGLLGILEGYLAITAFSFITVALLNHATRPPLRKTQYVVVLGSGLLHGSEVPPLLAGRIDAAIRFYEKAKKRGNTPRLIVSGGQGPDEAVPEAAAMREYALAHGVAAEDILVEDKSRNTQENLRNSKQLMDAEQQGKKYRCAIATSDYHALRARIYARREGYRHSRTLDARTARYYVANASIREYIAVMVMNRRSNLVLLAAMTACYAALCIYAAVTGNI